MLLFVLCVAWVYVVDLAKCMQQGADEQQPCQIIGFF